MRRLTKRDKAVVAAAQIVKLAQDADRRQKAEPAAPSLEWKARPTKEEDDAAVRTTWETKDGGYRVVLRVSKVGLVTQYVPMFRRLGFWDAVSRDKHGWVAGYKTKEAAVAACEAHNG